MIKTVKGHELECQVCQRPFIGRQYNQKFCSQKCKNKNHYEQRAQVWREHKEKKSGKI